VALGGSERGGESGARDGLERRGRAVVLGGYFWVGHEKSALQFPRYYLLKFN
jgi:hypothetical protein